MQNGLIRGSISIRRLRRVATALEKIAENTDKLVELQDQLMS